MTGQLALFPSPFGEQLALDIESTVFRLSDEATKPETTTVLHRVVNFHTECKTPQLTTTERPTMPNPTEERDYVIAPLRWLDRHLQNRRWRKAKAARRRRSGGSLAGTPFATLTTFDLITIRHALEDRERIHQGTPAGEAAHIARAKLG